MYSKTRSTIQPRVSISAAISDGAARSLGEFQDKYGGRIYDKRVDVDNHPDLRAQCQWIVTGSKVFPILDDLRSCGLCIKRSQADMMLSHRYLFPGGAGNGGQLRRNLLQDRSGLRDRLYACRAYDILEMTAEEYTDRMRQLCHQPQQVYAYAAGFCDSDGSFLCRRSQSRGRSYYSYEVRLTQKNRSFLQAFKEVVFCKKGGNVYTDSGSGVSILSMVRQADVLDFCKAIRCFAINKRSQLDVILSMPPDSEAKALLESMHGNQCLHRRKAIG